MNSENENDAEHDGPTSKNMGTAANLFRGVLQRADRTLSIRVNQDVPDFSQGADDLDAPVAVRDLLRGVQEELSSSKSTSSDQSADTTSSSSSFSKGKNDGGDDDDDGDILPYGANPTITMTALAHTLWKPILRPGKDSAIDATAGNGGDATVLAELLFAPSAEKKARSTSHLVCIDIQKEACEATQASLAKVLPEDFLHDQVSIHHGSHTPLALPPPDAGPVAIVAYNLGYLPGQERSPDTTTITQTSTTLTSLTDATLCLRVGGLLSVLTYPQTNGIEDAAVQAFVEGLALYSSQSHDWREFLVKPDRIRYASLEGDQGKIRGEIRQRLRYIHDELGARQCWRVHVHEKLGWVNAPRLLTAARVR